MRRLLWKEWQEQRWWMLSWVIGAVLLSALGKGVCPAVETPNPSPWFVAILGLALLNGLAGFGSELKGQRAPFLFSRAVSWKQVLAAKVLLGLAAVIITTLACTAANIVSCPALYKPFITPAQAWGALLAVALMTGVPYLLGLTCSIVLPGLAGGMLVLLVGVGLVGGAGYTLDSLFHRHGFVFLAGAVILLLVVIPVVVTRFGLTLTAGERVVRVAALTLALLLAGLLLDISPLGKILQDRFYSAQPVQSASVSPTGKFVYFSTYRENTGFSHIWERRADGRRYNLPYQAGSNLSWWLEGDLLLVQTHTEDWRRVLAVTRWAGDKPQTLFMRDLESGMLEETVPILVAPDRQRLFLIRGQYFQLLDLAANRASVYNWQKQMPVPDIAKAPEPAQASLGPCWWESDTVIGYLAPDGRRFLDVRVLPETAAAEATRE